MNSRPAVAGLLVALLSAACGGRLRDAQLPLGSAMLGKRTVGAGGMVSASQPDAAAAGAEMLRRGGNAMDAAVAAAFALSVTDISQTGLGGGGALLWYDARARESDYLLFYPRTGTDPAWADFDSTLTNEQRAPRAAAIPGMVAGLLEAHARHGRLDRATVLAPAIALARDGFVVTPLLSRTIASARQRLSTDSAALALLVPGGEPLMPGERLVQPALAATLARIAAEGAQGFYAGPVAAALVRDVQARGGLITEADLAGYAVRRTPPLCAEWRGHTVLSAPPPMGGPSVLAMLQMSEAAGVTRGDGLTTDGQAVTRLAGVQRLVTADAGWWRGDPAVMPVPARGFSSAAYAQSRVGQLPSVAPDTAVRGNPWRHEADPLPTSCTGAPFPVAMAGIDDTLSESTAEAPAGADAALSFTSHLAVVDADGNAVSATTTVGVLFGSGLYTGGFFLNSSAGNLDPRTRGTERFANSTIAPTLVLERGAVRLAIGAAGSQYIQPATAQVTMRILAFGEDPGAAIAAPRIQTSPLRREVEVEPGFSSGVYAALVQAGYRPGSRVADLMFGAVHGVFVRRDGQRIGIADPRRDGSAVAQ
jgi:gamma-glutamyltranspeptidase/glutathione hydrolase